MKMDGLYPAVSLELIFSLCVLFNRYNRDSFRPPLMPGVKLLSEEKNFSTIEMQPGDLLMDRG
jgi:hypothetical protein